MVNETFDCISVLIWNHVSGVVEVIVKVVEESNFAYIVSQAWFYMKIVVYIWSYDIIALIYHTIVHNHYARLTTIYWYFNQYCTLLAYVVVLTYKMQ